MGTRPRKSWRRGLLHLFLVKIGHSDPLADAARAVAVKRKLGDRASVRVDVNQSWDEATATRAIAVLQAGGIDVVEQPVPGANISDWRGGSRLPPARLLSAGRTRTQRLRLLAKLISGLRTMRPAQWKELNEKDPNLLLRLEMPRARAEKSFRNFVEMRALEFR